MRVFTHMRPLTHMRACVHVRKFPHVRLVTHMRIFSKCVLAYTCACSCTSVWYRLCSHFCMCVYPDAHLGYCRIIHASIDINA